MTFYTYALLFFLLYLSHPNSIELTPGQKARVSLARAVYAEADIYLLDDPLSAVDVRVGRQLLHGCIEGMLKDKTVMLVTHQVQCLKRADFVSLKSFKIRTFNYLVPMETCGFIPELV